MNALTIGDLSQSYQLRQRNTALKTQMSQFATELATGQRADPRQVLAGNFSYMTEIERQMKSLSAYDVAQTEAQQLAGSMQSSLARISDIGSDLSSTLIAAGTSTIGLSSADMSIQARGALDGLVGAVNTKLAGRYLYSGAATDTPPLPSVDDLLTGLRTAISGATTPAAVNAAAQNWFDDPAGFATLIYQGSDQPLAPLSLSADENVALTITANNPELKDALRLAAVAALASDPAIALSVPDQLSLQTSVGRDMLAAQDGLIRMQAQVGFSEARIDRIQTRNAAEMTSLEFAKSELLAIDPFEAATKLEEVQFQLQSLYSVTARMSQLSLVNFL